MTAAGMSERIEQADQLNLAICAWALAWEGERIRLPDDEEETASHFFPIPLLILDQFWFTRFSVVGRGFFRVLWRPRES